MQPASLQRKEYDDKSLLRTYVVYLSVLGYNKQLPNIVIHFLKRIDSTRSSIASPTSHSTCPAMLLLFSAFVVLILDCACCFRLCQDIYENR